MARGTIVVRRFVLRLIRVAGETGLAAPGRECHGWWRMAAGAHAALMRVPSSRFPDFFVDVLQVTRVARTATTLTLVVICVT
ncbi:MAG: hypothetical protein HKO53_13270 [Gemmatimonadetes bacterium]|nr:hypothetical protein [Gemmatimonadota bacterium]